VRKTRDTSGFYSSYQMLLDEEAALGRAELFAKSEPAASTIKLSADGHAVIVDLEAMFKAPPSSVFETESDRWAQRLADRATQSLPSFTKALRTLDQMVKSLPATARRVAAVQVRKQEPTQTELMAKATNALMHDTTLSAHARGMLLLGVSAAQGFAKSEQHPVAAQVEAIRAALEKARDERDLSGPAATYLTEALRHIENGIVDNDDRNRLMGLLQQLKLALAAGDSDALGAGHQQ
jgi:hypothetical protein